LTAETLAESLHLALAARALDRHGLFAALGGVPVTAAELAERSGLDISLLDGVLRYLAARTDLVEQSAAGFTSPVANDPSAMFVLRLYGDAFLPCSTALPAMLAGSPARNIDERGRGRAFQGAPAAANGVMAQILHQLEFNCLLDLGCGSGALLATLAAARKDFRGWGIDKNQSNCRAARARLDGPTRRRVRIVRGDVALPMAAIPGDWIDEVETIVVSDLLNEFMADGANAAVRWLADLAMLFPERVLVVADYYGRLMKDVPASPLLLLHDFVQLTSGQGIPPADLDGWAGLYSAGGWQLAHAIDDEHSNRFIHILKCAA
jgi:SAM-dependent methyltransferase